MVIEKAMALQWIKDNIHSFKGDGNQVIIWWLLVMIIMHDNDHHHDSLMNGDGPDDNPQITLFGESAGAGAVSVHLVSPISRCSSPS